MILFKNDEGPTRTTLEADVDEKGNLVLSGCDLGDAPREAFGDSDYEWWIAVPAEHRNAVLLELMKDRFGHATGTTTFMEWLDARAIPHTFKSL